MTPAEILIERIANRVSELKSQTHYAINETECCSDNPVALHCKALGRVLQRLIDINLDPVNKNEMVTELVSGAKFYGEESFEYYWLLPRVSREAAKSFCEDNNIYGCYGGPGYNYARNPTIRHSLSYTLIKQWCGRDI